MRKVFVKNKKMALELDPNSMPYTKDAHIRCGCGVYGCSHDMRWEQKGYAVSTEYSRKQLKDMGIMVSSL